MNGPVKLQISWSLLLIAVIHAALIGLIAVSCHSKIPTRTPEKDWTLPRVDRTYGAQPAAKIEQLTQPAQVNLQAQGELKQQAPCLPCQLQPQPQSSQPLYINGERVVRILPSRVITPAVVKPSQPSQPWVIPAQNVSYPASIPASAAVPTPAKKSYQVLLFLDNSDQSRAIHQWWSSDANLVKLREKSEFQVFTESNLLYRSRYATLVPASQFPVVLVQDATGGHIHAAGRTMIPGSAPELVSDIAKGYELYKQAKSGNVMTGAMKTTGYSWDDAINPSLQLASQDCPDGYCPTPPNNDQGWRPGDRWRDPDGGGLFDGVVDSRNAFVWANATEIMTGAMVVLIFCLLGFIVLRRLT
ncbi:MAG: hypothetical protein ACO1RT_21035 [Planctomycetaceae bacterium]